MPATTFQEVYVEQLKDVYSAETQLLKALPKVAKAVETPELKKAVEHHLEQTQNQVNRLDKLFKEMGETPGGKECKAMKGLIEEGAETIEEMDSGPVRDAALIVAAQKIEHYEIAAYGSVITWADQLGLKDHVADLEETLAEEKKADENLTHLAENLVNREAEEETAATR